ncbi:MULTISPECIES: helix-turn-helix domain-containing protein [Psychrobacter]|uniref:Helix-turn-helix domain-containing protein n=1 Tax=Psychrobacter namhaensis TaxID=292734 RepID=A0ABW8LDQ0_9GAMM|nr:helix-turn-helix domain-containing protein [Psychrobacter proteolyticus]
MTHFSALNHYVADLPADSQQAINNKSKILIQSIELAKLRKAKQLKQTELAVIMGVSQASISKVESGKDIQLSTLQNYVRALGGEVSIIAKMPNSDVILI